MMVPMTMPGGEHRSTSRTSQAAWAVPEGGSGGTFDVATFLVTSPGAGSARARDMVVEGLTSVGAAGVAVATGDAPWLSDVDGSDLGDRNPLAQVEPVGVGGVLDGGFDLLRVGFGRLVGLAAALLLPLQLIELLVMSRSGLTSEVSTEQTPMAGFMMIGANPTPFTWVFAGLRLMVLSFLGLAVGIMVRELLGGRLPSGRRLAAAAARRWWVAALIPLLTAPVKSLGFCGFYLGWFLLDAPLMCASVAAGAEGLGPLRAFGRSWTLAKSSYGTAVGISVGGFAVTMILQVALLVGPIFLVTMFTVSEGILLFVQQVASLVLLVTQPLTACIAGRAYVEFRCRAEALDLERRRVAQGLVTPGFEGAARPSAVPMGTVR